MTSNEMALMANIAVDTQKNEVNDVLDKIEAKIEINNIDKIVKILLWMLRKYKDDLKKEFSEYIQDSLNEYHVLNIIMDIIYDEINKEMPNLWYEYGFGLSEK